MEKRALLAVLLSLLVIIVYQYFFMPEMPVKPPVQKEKAEEVTKRKPQPSSEEPIDTGKGWESGMENDLLRLFEQQKKRVAKDIIIETKKYQAVINTKGAVITHWKVKDYFVTPKYETAPWKMAFWKMVANSYKKQMAALFGSKDEPDQKQVIDLFNSSNYLNGKGLWLISGDELKEEKDQDTYNGIYKTEADDLFLNEESPEKTISFQYLTANGLLVNKIFTFYYDSYQIDSRIITKNLKKTRNVCDYSLLLGPGLGNAFQPGAHKYEGPVTWVNGKKVKDKPKKKISLVRHKDTVAWSAMTSNYFTTAVIPQQKGSEIFIQRPVSKDGDRSAINTATTIGVHYPQTVLDPGQSADTFYQFYFGPKKYESLQRIGANLEQIIDYGFFSFLAKPLIWTLNLCYKFIPNYGIAIVLLTILIKIIFWPLTDKSFRSMKEMQEVQPKLAALRKKYKNDPKKLNEEVLGMYKQKGVNPMGGCLPLVLQIPVFFALYEGLMVAIEMRGAPFILWIKDLSVMDPLLITPILMGVTMYFQQKMTPMSGDATQMKMMTMLPLIFTVFFLGFPSGLVIYWLLNNILTIGQHYWILKKTKV